MSMLDDRLSNMVLTGQMTLDEALEESDDPSDLLRLCRLKRSAQYALRGYVALEYMKRELSDMEVRESDLRQKVDEICSVVDSKRKIEGDYWHLWKNISRFRKSMDETDSRIPPRRGNLPGWVRQTKHYFTDLSESELEYARAQMEALTRDLEEASGTQRELNEKVRKVSKDLNKQIDELSARMKDKQASLKSLMADIARQSDSARNNAVAAVLSGFGEILQYVADTLLS